MKNPMNFEIIKVENGGYYCTGEAGQMGSYAASPQRREIPLGIFEGKVHDTQWIGELMEAAARAAGFKNISKITVERLGSQEKEYADYSLIIGFNNRIIGKIREAAQ